MKQMPARLFKVFETPVAIWGANLSDENREFLNDYDCNYFQEISQLLYDALKNDKLENERRNALLISLRQTYLNSIESFFAFLFASIQSPDCIFGWLLKYQTKDLKALVQSINNGKSVFNKYEIELSSWDVLYSKVFPTKLFDNDSLMLKEKELKAIKIFANEFLDEVVSSEYNSIKHGVRCKQNSISKMLVKDIEIIGSEYGSEFIKLKRLEDKNNQKNNANYCYTKIYSHWNPQSMYARIQIIAVLQHNLRNYLLRFGISGQVSLEYLILDSEVYSDAFERKSGDIIKMSFFQGFELNADYQILTNEEIKKWTDENFKTMG